VYFTIVPLELFSFDRVYFSSLVCNGSKESTSPAISKNNPSPSFKITCDVTGEIDYTLGIMINYTNNQGKEKSVLLEIDPKLKIRHSVGP